MNTNFVYLACEENVKKRLLFLWEWNQPVNQSKGKQKEVVSEKGVGSLDENETSMRGKCKIHTRKLFCLSFLIVLFFSVSFIY